MTEERKVRETQPSANLAVAGALARARWTPDHIAELLQLPVAFTELLWTTARRDGEAAEGDDQRLIAALARQLGPDRSLLDCNRQPQTKPGHPTRPPKVSRLLIGWNVCVLLLAIDSNLTPLPTPIRAGLLLAAAVALALTVRQARRFRAGKPGE